MSVLDIFVHRKVYFSNIDINVKSYFYYNFFYIYSCGCILTQFIYF